MHFNRNNSFLLKNASFSLQSNHRASTVEQWSPAFWHQELVSWKTDFSMD